MASKKRLERLINADINARKATTVSKMQQARERRAVIQMRADNVLRNAANDKRRKGRTSVNTIANTPKARRTAAKVYAAGTGKKSRSGNSNRGGKGK